MSYINHGDEQVICPFNSSHYILKARLQTHLAQCAKNYPLSPMKICPFNGTHYMHFSEIDEHLKTCPERSLAERFTTPVGPSAPDLRGLVLKEANNVTTDDWDAVDQTSYLDKRDAVIKEKPVFLMGKLNDGKSARKTYVHNERLRMQSLAENNSAQASAPVPGGAKSPQKPSRGRGRGRIVEQ